MTAVRHLHAKELVEICEGHVPVLHLPARVADGVHGAAAKSLGGGPQGGGQPLPPGGRHLTELVEEQVLQTLRLQHYRPGRTGETEHRRRMSRVKGEVSCESIHSSVV